MGERGPVPKRADAKAGHRSKAELEVDAAPTATPVPTAPPAPEYWNSYVKAWYESLIESGQSYWYERSDWMTAIIIGEQMHRELSPKPIKLTSEDGSEYLEWVKQPIPGPSLSAIQKGWTDLLTTEAARRRAQINLRRAELDDDDDDSTGLATVTSISERAGNAG